MLIVEVDGAAVDEMIGNMLKHVADFEGPMTDEFLVWQADDMNRRHPEAKTSPDAVETTILARGRKSIGHRLRPPPFGRQPARQPIRRGPRPILRPELFEKLVERMGALMERVLTWR